MRLSSRVCTLSLFECSILIVAVQFVCYGSSSKGQHHRKKAIHDDIGESRGAGGFFGGSVPTFIVTYWLSELSSILNKDQRLAGLGLRLCPGFLIGHEESIDNVWSNIRKPPLKYYSNHPEALYKTHNTPLIDVSKGPVDQNDNDFSMLQREKLEEIASDLGGSPFALYQTSTHGFQKLNLEVFEQIRYYPNKMDKYELPSDLLKLEANKEENGKNCSIYFYSRSPTDANKEPTAIQPEQRQWTRLPLTELYRECYDGLCKLSISIKEVKDRDKGVCMSKADHGAPVMCGPDQKVTYLAYPHTEGCTLNFFAYKVAYMQDDIKKALFKAGYRVPNSCAKEQCHIFT